jgi:hypothetical protein
MLNACRSTCDRWAHTTYCTCTSIIVCSFGDVCCVVGVGVLWIKVGVLSVLGICVAVIQVIGRVNWVSVIWIGIVLVCVGRVGVGGVGVGRISWCDVFFNCNSVVVGRIAVVA